MESMYYIGLDVHKRGISCCVKDGGSKLHAEGMISSTRLDLDHDPMRFPDGKAVGSYLSMIPRAHSSGAHQRFGALTKQGNPFLRFVWAEAGAHAARRDPELQRFYRRKLVQKGLGRARVAVARKLGIRLWIMLRDQIDYQEFCRRSKEVPHVRECLETGLVRIVTDRLIRLPAYLLGREFA